MCFTSGNEPNGLRRTTEKGAHRSLPPSTYTRPPGLRQDPHRRAQSQTEATSCGGDACPSTTDRAPERGGHDAGVRERTAGGAGLRRRPLHAPRRRAHAGEGPLRRRSAQPRRDARGPRRRGPDCWPGRCSGSMSPTTGCVSVGWTRFRASAATSAESASSTRPTSTSRCCSTGERRRRARSIPPPPPTRRTCVVADSSTPAGDRSSTSPTRCSAGPAMPNAVAGVMPPCSLRSMPHAARGCATSSRPSRPSRTRSFVSITPAYSSSRAAPAPVRPWSRCTGSRTCSIPSASRWSATVCSWSGRIASSCTTSAPCCRPWARRASC